MSENSDYKNFKERSLHGRYVNHAMIRPLLNVLDKTHLVEILGHSVLQLPIYGVTIGKGPIKILMWSQMHGNESTTTKAVFDLLNYLKEEEKDTRRMLQMCTIKIIPMLNPDGAEVYTRFNANSIDLNRDAQELSQPESKILRKAYNDFKPDFCFNLHDQRTIFSAGNTPNPATISFLAPAADSQRTVTKSRLISMKIIAGMYQYLTTLIPNQIGRYDDGFNLKCVGDTFQVLGTPTILFEAGHFQNDYAREHTRFYIFRALWKAIQLIINDSLSSHSSKQYYDIPENEKRFLDIIIKNVHLMHDRYDQKEHFGLLFTEVLIGNSIEFEPKVDISGGLDDYYAHQSYDCADPNDLIFLKKQTKIVDLLN